MISEVLTTQHEGLCTLLELEITTKDMPWATGLMGIHAAMKGASLHRMACWGCGKRGGEGCGGPAFCLVTASEKFLTDLTEDGCHGDDDTEEPQLAAVQANPPKGSRKSGLMQPRGL